MWLLKCMWNSPNFKLEFLFNGKLPSLGPGFAVGEKGKKRGEMIPGGGSHMKQTGMLIGNFEFNP